MVVSRSVVTSLRTLGPSASMTDRARISTFSCGSTEQILARRFRLVFQIGGHFVHKIHGKSSSRKGRRRPSTGRCALGRGGPAAGLSTRSMRVRDRTHLAAAASSRRACAASTRPDRGEGRCVPARPRVSISTGAVEGEFDRRPNRPRGGARRPSVGRSATPPTPRGQAGADRRRGRASGSLRKAACEIHATWCSRSIPIERMTRRLQEDRFQVSDSRFQMDVNPMKAGTSVHRISNLPSDPATTSG